MRWPPFFPKALCSWNRRCFIAITATFRPSNLSSYAKEMRVYKKLMDIMYVLPAAENDNDFYQYMLNFPACGPCG